MWENPPLSCLPATWRHFMPTLEPPYPPRHQKLSAPAPSCAFSRCWRWCCWCPTKVLATVQHAVYLLCMPPTPLLSTLILWSIHSNPCCFEEKKRQDGGAWHSTEEHGMQNNEQHPSKALPCCAVLYIPLYVYCSSTSAIEIPDNNNRKCYCCHQTIHENMERTIMMYYSRLSYTYCTLTALIEYCTTVQIKSKLVDMDRVVGSTTRRARSLQQQGWMLDVGWFLDAMSTPLHVSKLVRVDRWLAVGKNSKVMIDSTPSLQCQSLQRHLPISRSSQQASHHITSHHITSQLSPSQLSASMQKWAFFSRLS